MMHAKIHMASIANLLGILGVIVILTTYLFLQTNKISADQIRYSLLNCLGSSMILFSLFYAWNLPSAIVEGVWVLISFYGIYKTLKLRITAH